MSTEIKHMVIEPDYFQVLRFQMDRVTKEFGAATAYSLVEVIRYLQVKDPEKINIVLKEIAKKGAI